MNENHDNFGLDNIQPLEPVVPTSPIEENSISTETPAEMPVQEPQVEPAFTMETPVVPVEPVAPVEPVDPVEPVSYEEPPVATTSFTEIPVSSVTQQPEFGVVNEHPDAKISLHKEAPEQVPVTSNLPEEKMDKSTLWMLIWLFVGMLAVIIALPYLFELF